MKKILFVVSLFSSINLFAETFDCVMISDQKVQMHAVLDQHAALVQIKDDSDALNIRELNIESVITMSRHLRKKENNYFYAKYYVDFNAWQDLEISVPKQLTTNKSFKAYLTVYSDNGDAMVPSPANIFNCVTK